MIALADLQAAVEAHVARVGEPRGDERRLHSGDLSECQYALWLRLQGEPQLPFTKDSIDAFVSGHAFEDWFREAFTSIGALGYSIVFGGEVEHEGFIGHPDVRFELDGKTMVVLDISTTKAANTEWKRSHALKTADYALALGAPHFAELVVSLGFGVVKSWDVHWFDTADWIADVTEARAMVRDTAARTSPPPAEPPPDMEWKCGRPGSGKSYCQAASCHRNARLESKEVGS